jgi:hypothetical protein
MEFWGGLRRKDKVAWPGSNLRALPCSHASLNGVGRTLNALRYHRVPFGRAVQAPSSLFSHPGRETLDCEFLERELGYMLDRSKELFLGQEDLFRPRRRRRCIARFVIRRSPTLEQAFQLLFSLERLIPNQHGMIEQRVKGIGMGFDERNIEFPAGEGT